MSAAPETRRLPRRMCTLRFSSWDRTSAGGRACPSIRTRFWQCLAAIGTDGLQDIPAEILVFYDVRQLIADVVGVDLHRFLFQIGALERDLFEQLLHDRVQAARADVLR